MSIISFFVKIFNENFLVIKIFQGTLKNFLEHKETFGNKQLQNIDEFSKIHDSVLIEYD